MNDYYNLHQAEILNISPLTDKEKLFKLQLTNNAILNHSPGQFVQVSIFGIGEAPISIASSPTKKGYIELCVRNAGELTSLIHKKNKGEFLGLRGPYGRGFPVEKLTGKNLLFVAGGLGLAPLRSLIQYVLDNRALYKNISILYGTRSPDDILFEKELLSLRMREDINLMITVDIAKDWWYGNVGVITSLFPFIEIDKDNTMCFVVGPPVMYKFVLQELLKRNIKEKNIYMSLERRMKCGLGKCGHCLINDIYVCQCGPVFNYTEIKDKPEAL